MLTEKVKEKKYIRSASLVLAKYFLVQRNEKTAAYYSNKAISLLDPQKNDNHFVVYQILCTIHNETGYKNEALKYGKKALAVMMPNQLQRKDGAAIYQQMAQLHNEIGNHKKAYDFSVQYIDAINLANFNEQKSRIDKIERQLLLSEKEKEIIQKDNIVLQQKSQIRKRNTWITIIAIGLLTGISIASFLYSRYRNSKRKIHILHQQKEINELKAMIEGEEKEKNRIATELHDNIGGMLSTVSYTIQSLQEQFDNTAYKNNINKLEQAISAIRNEVRQTAHQLMPDALIRNSLPDALQQYCNFVERETGLQIDIQHSGDFNTLNKDMQLMLYRISQELIQNVLKHAQASQIMVQLYSSQGIISLTVEDNGVGFNKHEHPEGRGLKNIQNRLTVVNGKMSIDTEPRKGCSVYIEIETE